MTDGTTDPGGPPQNPPRNPEEFFAALRRPGEEARRAALDLLRLHYGGPVHALLRRTVWKGSDEAKDLTETFFTWLLERESQGDQDPGLLSVSALLKRRLREFTESGPPARGRPEKGAPPPLGVLPDRDEGEVDPEMPPERLFDAVFLKGAVERALGRVRERLRAEKRVAPFLAFEEYHFAKNGPPPTYMQLAHRLGIKERDVRNYLLEVRDAVRAELRAQFELDGGQMPAEAATLFS